MAGNASELKTADEHKRRREQQILEVEKQIYELEGHLLRDPFNLITGAFTGISKAPTTVSESSKAAVVVAPEQRIFSLSSLTSPLGGSIEPNVGTSAQQQQQPGAPAAAK